MEHNVRILTVKREGKEKDGGRREPGEDLIRWWVLCAESVLMETCHASRVTYHNTLRWGQENDGPEWHLTMAV